MSGQNLKFQTNLPEKIKDSPTIRTDADVSSLVRRDIFTKNG